MSHKGERTSYPLILYPGCARLAHILQTLSERQILWSFCSVDFRALTLQLSIQTLHSVAPEAHVFVSSLENCQNVSKRLSFIFSL